MARDLVRDDLMYSAHTWVVKVGTSVLAAPDGTLDLARISHLAEEINAVAATGRRVALVSSGAVGAGIGQLGLSRRPPRWGRRSSSGPTTMGFGVTDGTRRRSF